jgi:HEAT repeat protein
MSREELRAYSKDQFRNNRKAWTGWLLGIAEMSDDDNAGLAIRLLAEQGDAEVFPKLAMISRDDAWPDVLRREAALGLVRHGDSDHAKYGLRSLGVLGTDEDARVLAGFLRQGALSAGLREVAALSLADTGREGAARVLFDVFKDAGQWQDREAAEAFQKTLLDAAGGLPFAATENHFRAVIESPSVPGSVRAAAAEALGRSTSDSLPFLLQVAAGDSNPEVREMAAWAISNQGSFEGGGEALAGMTRRETDSAVRTRLYEAMLAQEDNPSAKLIPVIASEEDDEARIAAWNALGDAVSKSPEESLKSHFDSVVVPRLVAEASGTRSLNLRMRSVFALRRAQTPESLRALESLSISSTPEIATAAANGLRASLSENTPPPTNQQTTYEN